MMGNTNRELRTLVLIRLGLLAARVAHRALSVVGPQKT